MPLPTTADSHILAEPDYFSQTLPSFTLRVKAQAPAAAHAAGWNL